MVQSKQAQVNFTKQNQKKSRGASSNEHAESVIQQQAHEESIMNMAGTDDVVQRLHSVGEDLKARERWTRAYQENVSQDCDKLVSLVQKAQNKILQTRSDFQAAILPIIAQAMDDEKGEIDEELTLETPIVLRPPQDTPVALEATNVLRNCEILMACYNSLCASAEELPTNDKVKDVFSADRQQVISAFEAAQTMSQNRLKVKLNRGSGATIQQIAMTDEQQNLARKILNKSKRVKDQQPVVSDSGVNTLLHDFGEIIGDLQQMAR